MIGYQCSVDYDNIISLLVHIVSKNKTNYKEVNNERKTFANTY